MNVFQLSALTISLAFNLQVIAAQHSPFPVMLAETYQSKNQQNSRYWVSEKYDGIRAVWTGKQLFTRSGNPINAPQWFIKSLPNFPLDGELWAGYGNFHVVQSLIHQQAPSEKLWRSIQYRIFDRPVEKMSFEQRYRSLINWFASQTESPYYTLIEHYLINDSTEIQKHLNDILAKGGEGLILRDPLKHYVHGRDIGMQKLKPYFDDEATVIGYRSGKGKYQGQIGSLIVKNNKQQVFAIGSGLADEMRQNPPEIGSLITYRYQGLTRKGKPRFARFLRIRLSE